MWIGYYSPITRISEFVAAASSLPSSCNPDRRNAWMACARACRMRRRFSVRRSPSIRRRSALSQTLTAVQRSGCVAGFSYLIWFLARFDSRPARLAVRPRDDGAGEISYSIYLLHRHRVQDS